MLNSDEREELVARSQDRVAAPTYQEGRCPFCQKVTKWKSEWLRGVWDSYTTLECLECGADPDIDDLGEECENCKESDSCTTEKFEQCLKEKVENA